MRHTEIHPIKVATAQQANYYVPPEKRQSLQNRFTLQGEGGYRQDTFNFVDRDKMYAPSFYASDYYNQVLGGYSTGPSYTTYAYTTSIGGTTYQGLSGIIRFGSGNRNLGAMFRDGNVFYCAMDEPVTPGSTALGKQYGPLYYDWIKVNFPKFKDLFMPSSYANTRCQAVLLSSGDLCELDLDTRTDPPRVITSNVSKFLAINQAHNSDLIVAKYDDTVWHVAMNRAAGSPATHGAQQIPGLKAGDIQFIQIGDPWNSLYVCLTSDTTKVYRLLTDMGEPRSLSTFKWITGVSPTPMNTAPSPAPQFDWFGVKTGETLTEPDSVNPTRGKHKPLTGFVPFNLLEAGEYFIDGASNEFCFTWLTSRYIHTFKAYGGTNYGYEPGLAYRKYPLPAGSQPVQMATSTSYAMSLQLTDGYYLLAHGSETSYVAGSLGTNHYGPYTDLSKFKTWNTLVGALSAGRPDIFGYSSYTNTTRNGLTATTTFNGDELNGIEDINGKNIIALPYDSPKAFEGFFYMDLFDNSLNIYRPSPITDQCVEAYGLPWRWSSLTQSGNVELDTIFNTRPKTWGSVDCGDRYEKRWIKQSLLEPAPTPPKVNTTCKKDKVIWTISTRYWSVSTAVGANITNFPYTLKYTKTGKAPYTIPLRNTTEINIQACQTLNCVQIPNTVTIYTDQISMIYVHQDIVRAVEDNIKPLLVKYYTANGHTVKAKSINDVVKILPINGKRYFKDLKDTGIPTMSANGTTNISLVFIDGTFPIYIDDCAVDADKTDNFRFDVSQYRSVLAATSSRDSYKFTIFSVTGGKSGDICEGATVQLSAVQTGANPNYPKPYNLIDMDVEQRYRYNIPFKEASGGGRTHPDASVTYYTNLIVEELQAHGFDLKTLAPCKSTFTFCDSVTAIIEPSPVLRLYTPNRFVPLGEPVKFENIVENSQYIKNIVIDYGDNIIKTYTGNDVKKDFFVTYDLTGYKTLNITITSKNKSVSKLTYPNIINVVSYYD